MTEETTTTTETTRKGTKGRPSNYSQEVVSDIIARLQAGSSIKAVAEALSSHGVTESAVMYYRKKSGLTKARATSAASESMETRLLGTLETDLERLTERRAKLVETFNTKRDEMDEQIRSTRDKLNRIRRAVGVTESTPVETPAESTTTVVV